MSAFELELMPQVWPTLNSSYLYRYTFWALKIMQKQSKCHCVSALWSPEQPNPTPLPIVPFRHLTGTFQMCFTFCHK